MIYIVKHKDWHNKVPDGYAEVWVGNLEARNNSKERNTVSNNLGKLHERNAIVCAPLPVQLKEAATQSKPSINHLNPFLNEATALYDLWKNKTDEIVGMCHYRRFFKHEGKILPFEVAGGIIGDGGAIIVSAEEGNGCSCHDYCRREYGRNAFDKYFAMLKAIDPNAAQWFKTATRFYAREMFVCHRKDMNRFCNPLFRCVLPVAEKFMKEDSGQRGVNKRLIGYMTERLFSYYVSKSGLVIKPMGWMWG